MSRELRGIIQSLLPAGSHDADANIMLAKCKVHSTYSMFELQGCIRRDTKSFTVYYTIELAL